jgi:group I intron endonuclease
VSIPVYVSTSHKACGIYAIINHANEHIYIGSSVNARSRWQNHRCLLRIGTHRNGHLQRAWNKYGEASFEFRLLMTCPVSEVRELEHLAIEALHPQYNLTASVEGETVFTEQHRRKIGAALRGRMVSATTRQRQRAAKLGRKQSADHIAKHVASLQGRPMHPNTMAAVRRPRSAETRAKMSLAAFAREAKKRLKVTDS